MAFGTVFPTTTSTTTTNKTSTTTTTACTADAGEIAKEIRLVGHTGDVQWQRSTNNSYWVEIFDETNATLNVGLLYATTPYFRAEVTAGEGCTDLSMTVKITDESFGTIFVVR